MAISYVGGQVGGRVGAASTTTITYALTGGSNSTPQAGDLVIVTAIVGSAGRNPAQAITAPATWTALGQLNPNTTTYDTSLNVSYKFMPATPDTTFTMPSTGNAQDAQRWTIQVFRGVDSTNPLDVAAVAASGTATGRPNPGSITPTTAGAWVVICGGGAAATGAAYTAPANYTTNFLTGTTADTNDAMVGSGYRSWTSGAEDPAQYTGGTTNAVDSWAAYTIALRPQTATTHATTGTLVGQGSTVAGTAKKNVPHPTTGALVGQGAVVTGAAARAAPGIRPILISTTVWQQDTLGTSGTPGAKSITVPADAQAVVVHFHMGSGGSNALSISSDFAGAFTIADSSAQNGCSLGYAVVSSTGAKNLTLSWTQTALEGPSVYISFIKNISTSDWVREVAVVGNDTNGTSATNVFDTSADDLLLVVNDQDGGTIPTTISGFTSLATTGGAYSLPSRLQSCDSPGATTTTVTGTTTNFDVLSGISIKPVSVTHATSGALVGQGAVVTGSANNGDLPVVIGTAQLTLGTSATPGAQNITVPAGTQLVVVFVGATGPTSGVGLNLSLTSNFAGTFTVIDAGVQDGCSIGYAVVSSTGAKTITPSWSETILEGPSFQLAFINNIDTGNFLLEAVAVATGNNTTSATYAINTNGRCILLAQEEQDGSTGIPATMSGYTSLQTQNNNSSGANLQQKQAVSGHPTTITGTGTAYDTLTAISIKRSSNAPVSHDTQGALVGSGATVAGSAQHKTLHTSTGALVGSGSTVAGAANRFRAHPATGALVGQGSTVTGSASRSAGAVTHATTGALVGQGSVIAGVSARFRAHPATGALVGPGATIAGTALRFRAHATTGAIVGSGATVSGSARHSVPHSTTGALVGSGSTVTGAAARNTTAVSHDTTGALTGSGATVAGAAARARIRTTTGALVGQGSTVTGSANRFRAHAATGALVGQGATVAGAARHNVPHAATGALVGAGATVAGAASRASSSYSITADQFLMIADVWQRLGLNPAAPLTETEASAVAGSLTITKAVGANIVSTRGGASDPGTLSDMLLDIWQRLGLDPANVMTASDTTIAAGGVSQTLTPTAGGVVVTRA
jgi:hypothetical protein